FGWFLRSHHDQALTIVSWMRQAGPAQISVYALTYAVGSVLLVPIVVMSPLAGFQFGPWLGLCVASPCAALGATCAFLVGRTVLRPWLEPLIATTPRVAAIDRAMVSHGLRLTLLVRLSPVLPHNLMNYALSATRISVGRFFLGTWIGGLPITTVQVLAGARAR